MPIEKLPVVHKFGIISHSQRLELQERLLKESYLRSLSSRKRISSTRNVLEVSDEFVQEYNNASSLDEQEKLDGIAYKMLERIKRRADLKGGGQSDHVDLPVAWTELAQLAQCKGKVQEDCLDVLILSLDQAPLATGHIPALFFLAETTLYWLRTEAIQQPYLRTGEIKLLRMGQLVFTRLFFHHMAGQLQGHDEFKNRLFTYLDGFAENQEVYSPYPNALLCLRYIAEVGKMVIGDSNTEAGEVKEGDNLTSKYSEKGESTASSLFHEVSANYEMRTTHSSQSAAISSSVHDLSPTLWHALDVWRCVRQLGGGYQDALQSLANCGRGLAAESWVDGICALYILADASKCNPKTLQVFQNLARGVKPRPPQGTPGTTSREGAQTEAVSTGDNDHAQRLAKTGSKGNLALSDIYEKSEEYITSLSGDAFRSSRDPGSTPGNAMSTPGLEKESGTPTKLDEVQKGPSLSDDPVPGTAWEAQMGDVDTARESEGSTTCTYTNITHPDAPGIHGWHWEVAVSYTDMLADICLHGDTSNIQKVALIGNNNNVSLLHKRKIDRGPLPSAGLLDLVFYKAPLEQIDGGRNDWSWRVRYSAIQGLVKICRCCAGDATKQGLQTVAWNTLLKANSLEKDNRVLEALKVGQVDANIEKLLNKHLKVQPTTLGMKMAEGLSILYLPPLPPPVEVVIPPKYKGKKITMRHPMPRKPLRTTLKEEIMLATALYEPPVAHDTRTNFDLKRVVEDQWRKQLQTELEEEEEYRKKELEEKQKKIEEEEIEMENSRLKKLGTKYRGPAYQLTHAPIRSPVRTPASSFKTKSPTSSFIRIPHPGSPSSSTLKSPSTSNSKLAVPTL